MISVLEEIGEKIWFSDNQMKLNTDKCHLLMNTQDKNFLKIGSINTKNFFSEKLLSITFDCKLRILTEKKHPKIKLQRLRKIRICKFGSLVRQINSF